MAQAARKPNTDYRPASQHGSSYRSRGRSYLPEEDYAYAGSHAYDRDYAYSGSHAYDRDYAYAGSHAYYNGYAYSDGYAIPARRYDDWNDDWEYEAPYEERWDDDDDREAVYHKQPVRKSAAQMRSQATLVSVVMLFVVMFFSVIFFSASGEKIQQHINEMNASTKQTQDDIDILLVELEQGKSVASVTDRAVSELGMIYPQDAQIIYVKDIMLSVSEESLEGDGT